MVKNPPIEIFIPSFLLNYCAPCLETLCVYVIDYTEQENIQRFRVLLIPHDLHIPVATFHTKNPPFYVFPHYLLNLMLDNHQNLDSYVIDHAESECLGLYMTE